MYQPLESNDPVSAEHLTPPRTVHTSKTVPVTNVNQAKLGAPFQFDGTFFLRGCLISQ